MLHRVTVSGVPPWVDSERLLGPAGWRDTEDSPGAVEAELSAADAADLWARLRNVGLGGGGLVVAASPPLRRSVLRAALTADARRRRDTTPGFLRAGARTDEEGRYSLTPEPLALALAREVAAAFDAPPRVLDAGCGCGGNAIAFARVGCAVIAVESDPDRLALARHNAGVYGVAERIRFVHGDAVEAARSERGEVLFADPPWGRDWNKQRTTSEDLPLLRALLGAFDGSGFPTLVAKVPPSFDPAAVPGAAPAAVFGAAAGDARRVKFVVLTLARQPGPTHRAATART